MFSYWKQAAIGAVALFVFGAFAGPTSNFFTLGLLALILAAVAAFPLSSVIHSLRTDYKALAVLLLVSAGMTTGAGAALAMPMLWAAGCFVLLSMVLASVIYDVRTDRQLLNSLE